MRPTSLLLAGLVVLAGALGSAAARERPEVAVLTVDGVIDPTVAGYLQGALEDARDAHAVVIRLDTPGGLEVSMRDIVRSVLESRAPVIVWVAPRGARAASAGTFIAYAAHFAYMAPATEIGAATPVNLGGEAPEDLAKKAVNDAVAFITELARLRGRNQEWAERAVRDAASVGATRAATIDVVDGIAGSLHELLQAVDGRRVEVAGGTVTLETWDEAAGRPSVEIVEVEMGFFQRLLHYATQPEIAYLLLSLGSLALLFELYTSGVGLAGFVGAVALLLGLYGLSVLPTNWVAVALIVLAMVLFVIDLHTPGLGVWTAGGALALLAGSVMLFAGAPGVLSLSPWVIALVVAITVPFFVFVLTSALRWRRRQPTTGAESLVGTVAEARTEISPRGTVAARGTLWTALTEGGPIPAGARVRIVSADGLTLKVVPAPEDKEGE